MLSIIRPWKFWTQLNDRPNDGNPDENSNLNCGPECLSMVLWYCRGIEVSADFIKDWILGQSKTGTTTPWQLSSFLSYQNIRNFVAPFDPELIRRYNNAGMPVIVLGNGLVAPVGAWHFVVSIGVDDNGTLVVANPWNGLQEYIPNVQYGRTENVGYSVYISEGKGWGF